MKLAIFWLLVIAAVAIAKELTTNDEEPTDDE
jgi:hypothetical protein